LPNDLFSAIEQANRVLDWLENLTKDEIPPEWMWPFEDDLEQWFANVEEQRKQRFGGGGDSSSDAPSGPMMKNEYAQGRGR
jgi:hypothetical protein